MTDSYFGAPEQPPVNPGRFVSAEELAGFELAPGLMLRPLSGTNMMVSFARYAPHAEAPLHAHEEEQIFVVLDGEFEVQLGDEVRAMRVGDAALIPSWVPHRVTAGAAGAYQLDVFCPPRQGLLDRLAANLPDRSPKQWDSNPRWTEGPYRFFTLLQDFRAVSLVAVNGRDAVVFLS